MKPDYGESLSLYTRQVRSTSTSLSGIAYYRCGSASATSGALCFTLVWTGARVSEVLALTPSSFQLETGLAAIRTLKRRQHHVREVPIPPKLMAALDRHFRLKDSAGSATCGSSPLALVAHDSVAVDKRVMAPRAFPGREPAQRATSCLRCRNAGRRSMNVRQKWMGHARPETTDIYSAVCGPEEIEFAGRFGG